MHLNSIFLTFPPEVRAQSSSYWLCAFLNKQAGLATGGRDCATAAALPTAIDEDDDSLRLED